MLPFVLHTLMIQKVVANPLQCEDGWGGNGEYCELDPDLDYFPDDRAVYCSEFTCKHVRIRNLKLIVSNMTTYEQFATLD